MVTNILIHIQIYSYMLWWKEKIYLESITLNLSHPVLETLMGGPPKMLLS